MHKILLFALLFFSLDLSGQTLYKARQSFWEAGILFGASNYSGDLAEKHIEFSETHLSYGAFIRYFFSKKFAVKAQFNGGSISGEDAHAEDPELKERSLRFGSDILELGVVGEWHFLGKDRINNIGEHDFFWSPYLYLGLGGVFGGAKTEYYGAPEDKDRLLQSPFPEVGPRQQFFLVPAGLGVRFDLNEVLSIGAEIGCRPVFSDKLDGVRLNGNPNKKDWYYIGGATVAFILGGPKRHR